MGRVKILGVDVDNITMIEAIDKITEFVIDGKYHYIVTPNVDHIIRLDVDKEFREIYKNADLVLVDGMPLIWISKFFNNPISEKISGSDLFPKVCEMAANKGFSVFLLGAEVGVAELAARKLINKYNRLNIVGTYSPPIGFETNLDELDKIYKIIDSCKPDILCLGLGTPKQEKFIFHHKSRLKVPVCLAIGAAIDFEAGKAKRAPKWMQKCGLEWFYRFCKEPKRMFKRYFIDDMKIFHIIFKYKRK